jgi:hypothetical protein
MGVAVAGGDALGKGGNIKPETGAGVDPDGLLGRQDQGHRGVTITQGLPQIQ